MCGHPQRKDRPVVSAKVASAEATASLVPVSDYLDPAYHDAYQQLCDAIARQAEAGSAYSLFGSRTSIVEPICAARSV